MGPAAETNVVRWVWDQQSMWSQAANRLRASLFRARRTTLWLTIVAAISATAAGQIAHLSSPAGKALAWLAAASAGLVAVNQTFTKPAKVEHWMRARSVSEALKAETYPYWAGVSPYRGADRETVFRHKVDAVIAAAEDLVGSTVGIRPAQRALPAVSDVDSYTAVRVQGQIDNYYQRQSEAMQRRARQFRVVETVLAAVAALISATAAVSGVLEWSAWLPVITTITAAIAAEAAAQRYSELAVEYGLTRSELERLLRDRAATGHSPDADDAFVHAAERVISLQNEAWMARGIAAAKKANNTKPPGQANDSKTAE
jgi:putative intracellular protease/amidase